jgi:hypothetical protein
VRYAYAAPRVGPTAIIEIMELNEATTRTENHYAA